MKVVPERDKAPGQVETEEPFVGAVKPGKRGHNEAGKVLDSGAV
jgi:hypothetical protein